MVQKILGGTILAMAAVSVGCAAGNAQGLAVAPCRSVENERDAARVVALDYARKHLLTDPSVLSIQPEADAWRIFLMEKTTPDFGAHATIVVRRGEVVWVVPGR